MILKTIVYMLIFSTLVILCTGCTDPDLPDPYEFENVTPGAPALQKSWDAETQTITISTLDDTPRLTIRKVSAVPDLCTFEEVLEIKSFVDYDLNKLKDFRARWKKHKGQHDISKIEWFILKNESYDITVNDYETIRVEETHYDNVTEEYYNVSVNQTVLTGNHSELRYHDIWKPFSPVGKSIHVGQTYTVKIVYHKPPEIGDIQIQTIPMFAGIECDELTWWNTSWANKREITINNTGGSALTYYQVNMDLSGTPINSTSLRVVNESAGATVPHWQEIITTGNCADLWFNATSIPSSAWLNETYYIYYENAGAASGSDGNDTFLQYHGTASSNFIDSLVIDPSNNYIFETKAKIDTPAHNIEIGMGEGVAYTGDKSFIQSYNATGQNRRYLQTLNDSSATQAYESPCFVSGVWYEGLITYDGTTTHGYWDLNEIGSGSTTNLPNENMGIFFGIHQGTGEIAWAFVRKHTTTEPTATLGAEEDVPLISSYAPTTPLNKLDGDSQIFNITALENCQCRWYIDGALVQTNATPTTTHAYTNTSLNKGYWNFTATANTSTKTSSQTWWVTVIVAGTFYQDMYKDRWMYATYLNSTAGNTNLSEQSTTLAPYYINIFNATDQKTYGYKSGRWVKYADKIVKPGEAAMLRYTANITKNRYNATSTFGFTMKTGLNHIGHSYNGSRNLTWYNTTIASANLVTIAHQNPETGALSTFTYGSADNGSVGVLQGCGVEVNVSADTVISGL